MDVGWTSARLDSEELPSSGSRSKADDANRARLLIPETPTPRRRERT
ncbi:MAG: hypothetical protein V5A16_05945 [Haloplanus sp.]